MPKTIPREMTDSKIQEKKEKMYELLALLAGYFHTCVICMLIHWGHCLPSSGFGWALGFRLSGAMMVSLTSYFDYFCFSEIRWFKTTQRM